MNLDDAWCHAPLEVILIIKLTSCSLVSVSFLSSSIRARRSDDGFYRAGSKENCVKGILCLPHACTQAWRYRKEQNLPLSNRQRKTHLRNGFWRHSNVDMLLDGLILCFIIRDTICLCNMLSLFFHLFHCYLHHHHLSSLPRSKRDLDKCNKLSKWFLHNLKELSREKACFPLRWIKAFVLDGGE